MLRNVRYSLTKGCTSHYILTAAKFQWARVSIHREVLQMHWTFSLDCEPKMQKTSMHLSHLAGQENQFHKNEQGSCGSSRLN